MGMPRTPVKGPWIIAGESRSQTVGLEHLPGPGFGVMDCGRIYDAMDCGRIYDARA